jgi:hypothetical protein
MLYLDSLLQNTDGFPNNYYLYKNPNSNKWLFIAHDFDFSFQIDQIESVNIPYFNYNRDTCAIENFIFEEMIPVWQAQLPHRMNALIEIANSSVSHPLQKDSVQKLFNYLNLWTNATRPCHVDVNTCWNYNSADNSYELQRTSPLCLNNSLFPRTAENIVMINQFVPIPGDFFKGMRNLKTM